MTSPIELQRHGQSCWLDDLTRAMLDDGSLRQYVNQGVTGITSNPSTFQLAVTGSLYDEELRQAAHEVKSATSIYELLAASDVRRACDALRPVYDRTNGEDGYVSLEVSPHFAHDSHASIEDAQRLFSAVNRPNVMIKIPGTVAALPAIEELLVEGINVNITLLFSIQRYEVVADAYQRALERRLKTGRSLQNIASVASFFLSRIDTLVDQLLAHRMRPDGTSPFSVNPTAFRGKVAVANAKLAYASFTRYLEGERWQALARHGARPQKLLWASTSTKNTDYHDLMYVEPLIGPHTINTMPLRTLDAFRDHGKAAHTIAEGGDDARRTVDSLGALGISLDQATQQLENEGIQKFIESYDEALRTIESRRTRFAAVQAVEPLARAARQLRRDVIRMTTAAGSGHPTSCMSAAEIVAALFFEHMRWDPADPYARNVDTFVLSKGHAAPILWAALARAGAIDEDLSTLRTVSSSLEGHPTPRNPWVKVATGSLGQGLSAANGIALANRLDDIDARIYCLLGDGECSEGSVWEAAQLAALHGLSNVVAIVDQNALGQSAPSPVGDRRGVLAERFRAFGWTALEVDGHDLYSIREALNSISGERPTAIVGHTIKGKGVSFLEGFDGWHGKPLEPEQCKRALADLGADEACPPVVPQRVGPLPTPPQPDTAHVAPSYKLSEKIASRKAFGEALAALGPHMPQLVVFDADVMNSTYTELFAKRCPERFFQSYIAEQNMIGAGLGMAVCGKIVVAATFACFLTRAHDFIRMAAHTRPRHFIFCGSHAGVSVGEDGPSQMGLEDIAMFRALPDSTVLCPSDAVSAQRLTELAMRTEGIVYLRTARPATQVLYANSEEFVVGGCKTLRRSGQDQVTLVGTGIAVYSALQAYDELLNQGIRARVIDAYSIKPLDVETLRRAAHDTRRLVVIEDHWADGGLGDAVAVAIDGIAPVQKLAIREEPRSAKMEEQLERHRISSHAISRVVMTDGAARH